MHIQLKPKKIFRAFGAHDHRYAQISTSHLTTFGKSNRLATLTQKSSLRSHHQTTPPRYARAYQLTRCLYAAPHSPHIAHRSPYRRKPSHTQTLHVGSQASPLLDSNQAAHADHIPPFQTHTPYFWCARPSLRSAHTSSVSHSLRSRSRHKHNRGSALSPPRGVYTLVVFHGVTLFAFEVDLWCWMLCAGGVLVCVSKPPRSGGAVAQADARELWMVGFSFSPTV